ncbi:MAG: HAD family hydrolase, partial [Phycisphaerae bacterium]
HQLPMKAAELAVRWGERFFALVDRSNHDAFRTLRECEHISLVETMRALERDVDPEPYVQILGDYWRHPPLHPEVLDAVARFSAPVCIVSNADTRDVESALARYGLRFDHVVTSEQARSYKPDTGIFESALRQTGWRRAHVIHVGDSLHSDIQGAARAGLCSGWVCRDDRIHDIGTERPDHTFRDLNELAQWITA